MRRYWSGEGSLIGDVASRMTGSSDLFNHDGRAPRASINHITVHDGFTLADLVQLQREAQRGQRRGQSRRLQTTTTATIAVIEGPTDDPEISRCAGSCARTCWPACCWRRACR